MNHIRRSLSSVNILYVLLLSILVLMPFHAFFTTWLGSNFGHLLFIRGWKEGVLIIMMTLAASLLVRDSKLRRVFFTDRLILLALCFAGWQLLIALVEMPRPQAALLGLVIQLRLVVIFCIARVITFYKPVNEETLEKIIALPAIGVIALGLLQMFILPFDFLRHFGYQKSKTIPAYFTIDEQLSNLRYASTLRGPNPLGTYLLVPIVLAVQKIWERCRQRGWYVALLLSALVVLYGSHSRGAWLGLVGALGCWLLLTLPKKAKVAVMVAGFALAVVVGVGLYSQRNTVFVQNTILHDNPQTGGAVSSNEGHLEGIKSAVHDVAEDPLSGCGPGCAGPASAYSDAGAKYAENYFLQTAQESGVIGLLLLAAICVVTGWRLYKRKSPFSNVLFVAFVGITIANLFSHAWADDTIAYLWWALAGLVLYTGNKESAYGKNSKKISKNSAA